MAKPFRTASVVTLAICVVFSMTFAGRAADADDHPVAALDQGSQQTGRRRGAPPPAAPTPAQILEGTDDPDTLDGGDSDDWLFGRGGNDTLRGNAGRDKIDAGEGEDNIDGGPGDDIIDGAAGADMIRGGDDNDTIDGGDENDVIDGGSGNDDIDGGDGDDAIRGGTGDDVLAGGDDNDAINGEGGNDRVLGNDGADTLSGGGGDDVLIGGEGDDTLAGDAGNDRLDGADGNDFLRGGQGNDTLLGSQGADSLQGGAGHDILIGGDGADALDGGLGLDWLHGGTGADTMTGGDGDDIFLVRAGDVPAGEVELVSGGAGTDALFLSGFEQKVELSAEIRLVDPVTGGVYFVVGVERVDYTAVLAQVNSEATKPFAVLLVNPSTTPIAGRLVFSDSNGAMVPAEMRGRGEAADDVTFTVPGLGSVRLEAVAAGAVTAQVFASAPLGAFVGGSPVGFQMAFADTVAVPVLRDRAEGTDTGVLIVNGATESSLKLTLYGMDGSERDDFFTGSRQIELPAYGHRAMFMSDLYPDLDEFRGVMTVDGGTDRPQEGGPVAVAVLERRGSSPIAASPALSMSPEPAARTVYAARVASGGSAASALLLVNSSLTSRARGTVRFFDEAGRPWAIVPGDQGSTDTVTFDLLSGASVQFELPAGASVRHGSARVEPSQGAVTALLRDGSSGTVINRHAVGAFSAFIAPVKRDRANGDTTSVSVVSTGPAVTLRLRLRTAAGADVAGGAADLQLPANGQVTRTIEELFPAAGTDALDGTLTVEAAGGDVSAVVMLVRPGQPAVVLPLVQLR